MVFVCFYFGVFCLFLIKLHNDRIPFLRRYLRVMSQECSLVSEDSIYII